MLKYYVKKSTLKKYAKLSNVDPWFLERIKEIVDEENQISKNGLPKNFNEFNRIKSIGFSDKEVSQLTNSKEKIVRQKTGFKFYRIQKS